MTPSRVRPLSLPESWLLRSLATVAAIRRAPQSLAILMFHRVLHERDPLLPWEPDARDFATVMDLLCRHFNVLRLSDGVRQLRAGTLPARSVCITFDDGYANNLTVAAPILLERKLPATVFVAPGFSDGGTMFNDILIQAVRKAPTHLDLRREGLGEFELASNAARIGAIQSLIDSLKYRPPAARLQVAQAVADTVGANLSARTMMSPDQIRDLHRMGFEVGAHTVSHPILTQVDKETARREIADSKAELEGILGVDVSTFAYPNGRPQRDYDASHVQLVREAGFATAVTTAWGAVTATTDPLQLPRIGVSDRTALRCGARILRAYGQEALLKL